jgi:glycosyltransferase involved in cell wall biosynthesis
VKTFVNELLASGQYRQVSWVRAMMVVQKLSVIEPARAEGSAQRVSHAQTRGMPSATFTPGTNRISSTQDLAQKPLVSCIMPTANRGAFVPQAIQYFLRQDYPNRELIVVDDGADPVENLIPPDARVRYVRLERKHTIGAKRNLACENANGEIVVHWDDDDWMANWRLSYQVTNLLGQRADICGLDKLVHYDAASNQAWQYVYPQGYRPWVAGNTLGYTKRLWSENPFPDLNIGEDTHFLWSRRSKKIVALRDNTFYVALIHPGNTSPKQTQRACWHSYPTGELRDLIGADWMFYANLLQDRELPP